MCLFYVSYIGRDDAGVLSCIRSGYDRICVCSTTALVLFFQSGVLVGAGVGGSGFDCERT